MAGEKLRKLKRVVRGHLNQMIVIVCKNSGMGKVKKTEKVIKVMTDTTDTSVYVMPR